MSTIEKIRVRFAPSPTGPLHIGGVRTALYNYLFARKHNGIFILRIEDTDRSRFVESSEEYISATLKWLNIVPEESPTNGGKYGPYKQSQRKDIYKKYVNQLITEELAYYAFDTPEELDTMRQNLKSAKIVAPQYNSITRMTMKNSISLPQEEVERMLKEENYVIRLKTPKKESIRFYDEVRGWINVKSDFLDDKVLMKSDGMPTYHLASVVDDHLMKISHVIRGEEWLSSTPIHILLYQYLKIPIPKFAHLPLLLNPNGVGKLSKRYAGDSNFPIFPLTWQDSKTKKIQQGFKEQGYLSEALINFLALLGWSPGNNEEIFSLKRLAEIFSLNRIGKSGIKFDIKKAQWFNKEYIKKIPVEKLTKYLTEKSPKFLDIYPQKKINVICKLLSEKITFLDDLYKESTFFITKPSNYDLSPIKKLLNDNSLATMKHMYDTFSKLSNFDDPENIKQVFKKSCDTNNIKMGHILPLLRVAITNNASGPDLSTIISVIDKNETLSRLGDFIREISDKN